MLARVHTPSLSLYFRVHPGLLATFTLTCAIAILAVIAAL
jgi:hypothetical protein